MHHLEVLTKSLTRRPCVVIDIDETMLFKTRWLWDSLILYTIPKIPVGIPLPHLRSALQTIRRTHDIVALTARWKPAGNATVRWMERANILDMFDVLGLAEAAHPLDHTRISFKRDVIMKELPKLGWTAECGIGDRPSDLSAYLQAGIQTIMVSHLSVHTGLESLHRMDANAESKCTEHIAELMQRQRMLQTQYPVKRKALPAKNDVLYVTDSAIAWQTYGLVKQHTTRGDFRAYHYPEVRLEPVWKQIAQFFEEQYQPNSELR